MIIYCDLDQVLCNFLGGARKALGKEFNDPSFTTMTERWQRLAQVENFWTQLDWMPEAQQIWDRIRVHNPHILSASPHPKDNPRCAAEKFFWCERQLGTTRNHVHIVRRSQKMLYAVDIEGNPNILIDDHPVNVKEWTEAGGISIFHQTVPATLTYLTHLGILENGSSLWDAGTKLAG